MKGEGEKTKNPGESEADAPGFLFMN